MKQIYQKTIFIMAIFAFLTNNLHAATMPANKYPIPLDSSLTLSDQSFGKEYLPIKGSASKTVTSPKNILKDTIEKVKPRVKAFWNRYKIPIIIGISVLVTAISIITIMHFFPQFTAKVSGLSKTLEEKDKALQQANTEKNQALNQVAQTNETLTQVRQDLAQADAEKNQALNQVAQTNEALAQANQNLAQANAEKTETLNQVAQTDEILTQVRQDLAQANAEKTETLNQVAQTDEILTQVRQDLAQANAEETEALNQVAQTDEILALTNVQINSVNPALETTNQKKGISDKEIIIKEILPDILQYLLKDIPPVRTLKNLCNRHSKPELAEQLGFALNALQNMKEHINNVTNGKDEINSNAYHTYLRQLENASTEYNKFIQQKNGECSGHEYENSKWPLNIFTTTQYKCQPCLIKKVVKESTIKACFEKTVPKLEKFLEFILKSSEN